MLPESAQRSMIRGLVQLSEAGNFSLPDPVLHRVATIDRVASGQNAGQGQKAAGAQARDQAVQALLAGEDPTEHLREAILRRELEVEVRKVTAEALQRAGVEAVKEVRARGEEIITDHLRPALEDVLAQAQECARALRPYLPDPQAEELVGGTDPERAAWAQLQDLPARYSAIRDAQDRLGQLGVRCREDPEGIFAELRNYDTAVGTFRPVFREREYPWPSTPTGRLLWLVTSDAQPWLPTPAEQRAVWEALDAERRAKQIPVPRGGIGVVIPS